MHDYKNDEVVTMQLLEAVFAHCACFTIFLGVVYIAPGYFFFLLYTRTFWPLDQDLKVAVHLLP